MGIEINSSRGRKSPQEIARLATLAHNKKKIIITSVEPIEFLDLNDTADEVSSVNVADLVDAVAAQTSDNEVDVEVVDEDEESPEEKLRYGLSTMKKAGLKEYAEDSNVDISEAKTNKEIIEAIISASF